MSPRRRWSRVISVVLGLLLGLAIPSCKTASTGNRLRVGMPQTKAVRALADAKAKRVQMDMVYEASNRELQTFELRDGRVVLVTIRKKDRTVVELSECRDAHKPKAQRTWTTAEQIRLVAP